MLKDLFYKDCSYGIASKNGCISYQFMHKMVGKLVQYINNIFFPLQTMKQSEGRYQLSELQIVKNQIITDLPNKQLKEYLNYQHAYAEEPGCINSIKLCLKGRKYNNINPTFKKLYENLEVQDRLTHYVKVLDTCKLIIEKRKALPQSTTFVDESPTIQDMQIVIKAKNHENWQQEFVQLDYNNKRLVGKNINLDLKYYLLYKYKAMYTTYGILKPLSSTMQELFFNGQNFDDLFQRLDSVITVCFQERLIKIIEGDLKIAQAVSQQQYGVTSERYSLADQNSNKLMNQKKDYRDQGQYDEVVDYLKYYHPVSPIKVDGPCKVLKSDESIHYLMKGQYQISKEGELIAINQQKLQQQSGVIKYIIKRVLTGTRVFNISLPTSIFSCQSNLSLLLGSYRFAPLILENSSHLSSLQRFKKVIKFAFTCPPCYIRCDKPFNPILGQTFQRIIYGTVFYGEQISHHPPISSAFIKGKEYTLYGNFQSDIEFGLNTATGNNKGWVKISFDSQDFIKKVVKFTNAPGQMGGLIYGKRSLCLIQSSLFYDQEDRIFCQVYFGKIKLQKDVKQFKDSIEGRVVKLKATSKIENLKEIKQKDIEVTLGLIHGRWLSDIYFNNQLLINTLNQSPPVIESYPGLLRSDYSFRQDIILRRNGPSEQCQAAKEYLQQIQRNDRKLRSKYSKS